MKKLKRWVAIILGSLLTIILVLVLYVLLVPLKTYEVKAPVIKVSSDSISLAEGKRMAVMLCQQCHLGSDGSMSGALMEDGPFGTVYSRNITNHPEFGIGSYTDGELAYLLRTGIRNNGTYTPPWMAKLPHLSEEDIHDIIAFLRSDDPLVAPSTNTVPEPKYSFLSKALIKFGVFHPLEYPGEPISPPDTNDVVAFGRYQAVAKWDCYSCHSLDFTKLDVMEPEKSVGFFGGGNPFEVEGSDDVILSANLTFDQETGIGSWSEADFVRALKTGIKPDKTMTQPPMTPFTMMTDAEAKAIYAYLKTLPVIHNEAVK